MALPSLVRYRVPVHLARPAAGLVVLDQAWSIDLDRMSLLVGKIEIVSSIPDICSYKAVCCRPFLNFTVSWQQLLLLLDRIRFEVFVIEPFEAQS